MRVWTMVLSLVMACVVAASACAAEKGKGEGKKRGDRPRLTFADIDANKDGKIDKDEFVAAHLKNMPEDRKEKGKEYIGKLWDRLAGDKKELNEDEFKAAQEKMRKEWQDKGGKKRGEKKDK